MQCFTRDSGRAVMHITPLSVGAARCGWPASVPECDLRIVGESSTDSEIANILDTTRRDLLRRATPGSTFCGLFWGGHTHKSQRMQRRLTYLLWPPLLNDWAIFWVIR